MVGLTTKTQIYIIKRIIQGMLNIFYILYEKDDFFFSGRGDRPPPLIGDMFAIKSIFFDALTYFFLFFLNLYEPARNFYEPDTTMPSLLLSGSYQLRSGSYTLRSGL